jgi:Flp pilus assembly protein CpaB
MRKLIIFFRNLNRLWLLMALALVLGLAAAMLFSSYLKGREEILIAEAKKRASGGDTVEIITPSLNVPKGTVLGTQNLSKREILADLVTEEMVLVSDFGRVDGIRATRSLQAGLPLDHCEVIPVVQETTSLTS